MTTPIADYRAGAPLFWGYFLGLGLFAWGFRHLSPEPCASATWLPALQATTGKEGTGGYGTTWPSCRPPARTAGGALEAGVEQPQPPQSPRSECNPRREGHTGPRGAPVGSATPGLRTGCSLLTALSLGLSCQAQSAQLGHHPSGASHLPRGQTRLPTHRLRAHWLELQPAECEPRGASFNSDCLETSGLNVRALGVTVVLRPNFHKP